VPPPDPVAEEPAYTESDWQPEVIDPEQIADLSKGWVNGWEHAGEAAVIPATAETGAEPPTAAEIQPAAAHPTIQEEDTQILGKRTQAVPVGEETPPESEMVAPVGEKAPPVVQKEPPVESDETARINAAARAAAPTPEPPAAPADGMPLTKADDWGLIEPPPDTLEDTRPGVISTITQLTQLETTSPALSLLNYTCVLVPRMPGHYLAGELADKLSQWVAQLCVAFGWRLEGIAVRPEYLQWNVQVAPAVSPGNLVRILRQRTSQNIFQTFAGLAEDNPSGDFWASGYLIVSGPQPPSAQLLRDYIARTRKRQGVTK
jgi:REP element-mobilizing transposase RayT